MDIITKLIRINNDKSSKLHSLSRLLLLHIHSVYDSSIYEMADLCFSSPTALSRFVKSLEYTGYAQFKHVVNDTLNSYYNKNRVVPKSDRDDISSIREYVSHLTSALNSLEKSFDSDILDEICARIYHSSNILCISPEIGNFQSLQYDLFLQGKTSIFPYGLTETEEYIRSPESGTFALVFIPPERESARLEKVLKSLQSEGIGMAIFSDRSYSRAKNYSDLIIWYDATTTNMDTFLYNAFIDVIALSYRKLYIDSIY